ncbi:MAG: GNAT family N-acetyltransferase [Nitrospinota bacterium]|nr:GNAT family N-acetyltransferase [Nitrospinota bacterium]
MSLFVDSQRVRFHKAIWADIPAMQELDARLFPPHSSYDMETFRNLMLDATVTMIVAQAGREMAGFMILRLGPGREASALTIDVAPSFQGHGVGSRLMALAERMARYQEIAVMYLQVSTNNSGAIRFYERLGYCRIRFMKGYYGGEEDGWEMEKKLIGHSGATTAGKDQPSLAP